MQTDTRVGVVVLGATGLVGQTLITLLDGHPCFEVTALCASDQNVGLTYEEAVNGRWLKQRPIPAWARSMTVQAPDPALPGAIALSALESHAAQRIEPAFVTAGWWVSSNAGAHRMHPGVPLIIPEINADHLSLVRDQSGGIVANPNCCVAGLALALAPLHRAFGLRSVHVTTLQALSGAGYPGRSGLDVVDNVIPFIAGEEEKLESEPLKILGTAESPSAFQLSAQCHRVPVLDGHTLAVTAGFARRVMLDEVEAAWEEFSLASPLNLPSATAEPLVICTEPDRPQPRLDRDRGSGMSVSVGRLRADTILDVRFTALVHNLVRGAAGAALLNAELLLSRGVRLRKTGATVLRRPEPECEKVPL